MGNVARPIRVANKRDKNRSITRQHTPALATVNAPIDRISPPGTITSAHGVSG